MYFNTGQRYNKGDDPYSKNGFLKWESTKDWYKPTVEGFEFSVSKTNWSWVIASAVIVGLLLFLWYRYKK
jgi:hypothetical protein